MSYGPGNAAASRPFIHSYVAPGMKFLRNRLENLAVGQRVSQNTPHDKYGRERIVIRRRKCLSQIIELVMIQTTLHCMRSNNNII